MKRFSSVPCVLVSLSSKPTFLSSWHCAFFPGFHWEGLDEGHTQGKKARKNDGEGLAHNFPLWVYVVKWLGGQHLMSTKCHHRRWSLSHVEPEVTVRKSTVPSSCHIREPSPRCGGEQRHTTPETARDAENLVNCSTRALTSWFFRGKSERVHLDSQGRARNAFQALWEYALCLPGAWYQGKTSFSPSDCACAQRASCVTSRCTPNGSTGRRSNWNWHWRRKFQINTVTVYKIETLIEKRNPGWCTILPSGDVSWLVSYFRLRKRKNPQTFKKFF